MSPKLAVQISTALPQVTGIKYGDLLLGLKDYYIYVRLDQPGDPRWFLARLTTNMLEAANNAQLHCALSEATKQSSSTDAGTPNTHKNNKPNKHPPHKQKKKKKTPLPIRCDFVTCGCVPPRPILTYL